MLRYTGDGMRLRPRRSHGVGARARGASGEDGLPGGTVRRLLTACLLCRGPAQADAAESWRSRRRAAHVRACRLITHCSTARLMPLRSR
jgi:hypothetical protein